jgi:hypothetical protein
MAKHVCELPVMKASCKTCPFREVNGRQLDPQLAAEVTGRTLFTGQQICHGTEGPDREPNHRCRGSFDYNKTIYDRMGIVDLVYEEPMTLDEAKKKRGII